MLSDPSYADAYAPAYAKPFIAEEHMAHILGRLSAMPSEEAIEALRAKGYIVPSASVMYIMRDEGMCRFDLCTDGKWHQSSSLGCRPKFDARCGPGRYQCATGPGGVLRRQQCSPHCAHHGARDQCGQGCQGGAEAEQVGAVLVVADGPWAAVDDD
jgi:hypothetical protein